MVIILFGIFPEIVHDNQLLVQVFTFAFAFSIFAASWDIIYGYAGQVNLGTVFTYGIAGFTSALIEIHTNLPDWAAFALGPLVATGASVLLAAPSLRMKGNYLSIVTFAISIVAQGIAIIKTGEEGLSLGIRQLFGGAPLPSYYLGFILMIVSCGTMYLIGASRIGMRFKAIRDDEMIAEAIGINSTRYKLFAFSLSSFFSGVAGSFITLYIAHVDNTFLSYTLTFQTITMAVVGGVGTIIGSILGTFLLYVPSSLLLGEGVYHLIIYGVSIVVVLSFAPLGILPYIYGLVRRRARRRMGTKTAEVSQTQLRMQRVLKRFSSLFRQDRHLESFREN